MRYIEIKATLQAIGLWKLNVMVNLPAFSYWCVEHPLPTFRLSYRIEVDALPN